MHHYFEATGSAKATAVLTPGDQDRLIELDVLAPNDFAPCHGLGANARSEFKRTHQFDIPVNLQLPDQVR